MIIDGKDCTGKRVSASVDDYLWDLFRVSHKTDADARREVRDFMALLVSKNLSLAVRRYLIQSVAKPSLVKKAGGHDAQMDIEES